MRTYLIKGVCCAFISITLFVLTACNDNQSVQEEITLKVLYWDEKFFMDNYGSRYLGKYPKLTLEVVPIQQYAERNDAEILKVYSQLIEEEQIDVLLLTQSQYKRLLQAEDNFLFGLNEYISSDFNLDDLIPAVVDELRDENGHIYGLAPTFDSSVLYYNIDLFNQYGIPLPDDGMSWDDLYQLAARFPGKSEEVYGYMEDSSGLFEIIYDQGKANGLSLTDYGEKHVVLDSDSWRSIWEAVISSYQAGGIYLQDLSDGQFINLDDLYKPFLDGKAAMLLGRSYILDQLQNVPFQWGYVSQPLLNDGSASDFLLSEIFAITKASDHKDSAWELVKFINGEEVAQFQSQSGYSLSTRIDYVGEKHGFSMEPFYNVTPRNPINLGKYERQLLNTVFQQANEKIQLILLGEKDLDQALSELKATAQAKLDELRLLDSTS